MNVAQLVAQLHFELTKARLYVDDARREASAGDVPLYFALQEVTVDLPVELSHAEVVFDVKDRKWKDVPDAVRRLAVPCAPETVMRPGTLPSKPVKGIELRVSLASPTEKARKPSDAARLGRLTLTFKLITS